MPTHKTAKRALNVNIETSTDRALRTYAERNRVTLTEALRRFVIVGEHILTAQERGDQLMLRRKAGESGYITYIF